MLKGIDVYHGQGKIDWSKVTGLDFVIMKIGEGRSLKDTQFENNYKGCKKAGIPVGAYHFSRAETVAEAKQEAAAFLSWAKGKTFEYPVYLDMECTAQSLLAKPLLTEIANTWLTAVKAGGFNAGIYTNPDWIKNHINISDLVPCEKWIAQWATKSPTAESYGGLWQYGDIFCTGIGYVDGDFSYKDYAGATIKPVMATPSYFPACKYTGYSIVDGLRSIGAQTSFGYRLKIANKNGIILYVGTAGQNVKLLNLLKAGKLIKP